METNAGMSAIEAARRKRMRRIEPIGRPGRVCADTNPVVRYPVSQMPLY
jgi:hypothetical protein